MTLREKLEGLVLRSRNAKAIAEYEAELALPTLPPALHYLWQAFHRLHRRRTSNGFGPNPITWSEIDAFERHSGLRLAPWEVEVIEDLDDLYRIECAKAAKPND